MRNFSKVWNKHLEKNEFGMTSFWINRRIKVLEKEVNISCFLILNVYTPIILSKKISNLLQAFVAFNPLISELEDVIKLSKKVEEHEMQEKVIRNYGHTIFNSMPNVTTVIYDIEEFLGKNYSGTSNQQGIVKCRKQLELIDLTLRIMAKKDVIEFEEINIAGILKFIQARQVTNKVKVEIDYTNYPSDLDKVQGKSANDAFLILWNLWHNASKCKSYLLETDDDKIYTFRVELYEHEGMLAVAFENLGSMKEKYKKYLETGINPDSEFGGLQIIRDRMEKLGWELIGVEVVASNDHKEVETTKIKIKTH